MIKDLLITSDGSCTFKVFKDKKHIQSKEYNFGKILFEKEFNYEDEVLLNSKICLEIQKKLKFVKKG